MILDHTNFHVSSEGFQPLDAENYTEGFVKDDNYDDINNSAINLEASSSQDMYQTSQTTTPSRNRKSPCVQAAAVFTDANKERSLSVTTQQMLGKLQDGEIKRFLTGLGNLAKSCELQNIENSGIQKRNSCFKEKETTSLKYNSTSKAYSTQDATDYENVDTVLIANQTQNMIGKSCAV